MKGSSVNLADSQSTFEAALNFGPQHQCSQRHFISRVYLAATEERGGVTFVPMRANILQMHLMQSKWRQTPTKLLELGYLFLVTVSVKPFMAWGSDHNPAGLGKFPPIS